MPFDSEGPTYGYLPDYVIEMVAHFPEDKDCVWCPHVREWGDRAHAPNCPVTVARDLLGKKESDDEC